MPKTPAIGDMVLYVIRQGIDRPAIVLAVNSSTDISILAVAMTSEDQCASSWKEVTHCFHGAMEGNWHW